MFGHVLNQHVGIVRHAPRDFGAFLHHVLQTPCAVLFQDEQRGERSTDALALVVRRAVGEVSAAARLLMAAVWQDQVH
jgi:hypothetical protein